MARELHTCLIRYFARLKEMDSKWKELSQNAQEPLEAMIGLGEQFRVVACEEIEGTEDIVDEETRGRLIFQILMSLEDKMSLINNILTQFNYAKQDLKSYLVTLEDARSKVSLKDEAMQELIKGTPCRPALDRLLVWSMEGFQFYDNMYHRINECVQSIDYKSEETINDMISSFKEDKRKRKNLNWLLAHTQFLIKESLPVTKEKKRLDESKLEKNRN
ncbi:uncharacterized protein LOC109852377 isoform X1 [Pseudomyrmex gracilis]|uniref:uncharacterized protein LOC109852377 isoform X1 n=2 Tax=Pseudomyrmex gracilis TaxID=219809 RepID=UPI0009956857|nr:uncharacterized protein LOC109852377 isoform X1 [Pseudomyrmex gracilis]